MRPGLPARHNLASQDEKYAYRHLNIKSHGLMTHLMDHLHLCPILYSPSLQNSLINIHYYNNNLILHIVLGQVDISRSKYHTRHGASSVMSRIWKYPQDMRQCVRSSKWY